MIAAADVSVVLAVRDGADRLAEALASIRAQTVRPAEVLLVDGGSTDGTRGIAAAHPEVEVLEQVGPTLAGMALLCPGSPRFARAVLLILAGLFGVTIMFWLRNPFGVAFLIATAAVFIVAARYLPGRGAAFLLHLIAVTLCLSWFTDLDYMFSEHASVNGGLHLSDSAVIAQALGLPYWFWGGLGASFSLAIVIDGIRFVSRSPAWPSTTPFPGG